MSRAVLLIAGLLAAGPASAPGAEDLTAVLTQVEGNITVRASGPVRKGEPPPVRRGQPFQIVRRGDEIRVPGGARAGLVCSTDSWLALTGEGERRLTPEICRTGEPLPPGTYARLAPRGGRLRSLQGAMVLESLPRGSEEETAGLPIVLSPRNTAVLEPRPSLVWTQVPGATSYTIEMRGEVAFALMLDAAQVSCAMAAEEGAVCSIPYPDAAPDLPSGSTVFLRVGARRGSEPFRGEQEPLRIRRLSLERATEIAVRSLSFSRLTLGETARSVLEASLHAEHESYTEAIRLYQRALAEREISEVRVSLGDAYLAVGLTSRARQNYERAMTGTPEPAVRAAALFGLGRAAYVRGGYRVALGHLQAARDLFRGLGLAEESSAAAEVAARAEARLREEGSYRKNRARISLPSSSSWYSKRSEKRRMAPRPVPRPPRCRMSEGSIGPRSSQPSVIATARSRIGGPMSRAITVISPRGGTSSSRISLISPRMPCLAMFVASSETTIANSAERLAPSPNCKARRRAWGAMTTASSRFVTA